jgi:RHS repeat-associated protein
MRLSWLIILSVISGLLAAPTAMLAQTDEIPTRITDQNRTGDVPFSAQVGTDIETVDLATGALHVRIPILQVKGRGLDYDFHLYYDSNFYVLASRVDTMGGTYHQWSIDHAATHLAAGWAENTPYWSVTSATFACKLSKQTYYMNHMYHDENNGKHVFAIQKSLNNVCPMNDPSGPDLGAEGLLGTNPAFVSATGHDANGTLLGVQEDSNGNISGWGENVQDSLGRTLVTAQRPTNQTVFTVLDSNGGNQTYTVNYDPTYNISTNLPDEPGSGSGVLKQYNQPFKIISSILLPNQKSYAFKYDQPNPNCYANIVEIDLPTGAVINYSWGTFENEDFSYSRKVTDRTVTVGGQQYHWHFAYDPGSNATVTDPLNNQSYYGVSEGTIITAAIYQGAAVGNPMRQYQMTYVDDASDPTQDTTQPPPDPQITLYNPGRRLTKITTTLDDGRVAKKEFDYETFNYTFHPYHAPLQYTQVVTFNTSRGNVTETREYDYGSVPGTYGTGTPGPLLRRTDKTYLHNSNSNYLTYNIVNKVLQDTVYDVSSNQKAQTQYEYDTTSLVASGGAPQHDSTYSTAFIYRGNPSKVKRWRNTDGQLLTTTYNYDDLGNIRSILDSNGNSKSYGYTDAWQNSSCPPPSNSNAYVTTITNVLSQQIKRTYFPCTGLLYAHRDQNDITAGRTGTLTFYNDPFGRVTSTQDSHLSNGTFGQTTNTYNDTPPVSVSTAITVNSTVNKTSVAVEDGLGRVSQTQLTSDPDGTTYVDTSYDALGRKATVSNPHRSGSLPTDGTTTYSYDPLSRTKSILEPDGSQVLTTSSGICSTVTDEAGKIRKSCSDALGRLTQVFEDPNGVNYETDYGYDALNNLTQVTQGSETRAFSYDSLSRLLSAANPESGTTNYSYLNSVNALCSGDPGNPCIKTDARGIATFYSYDTLNRLTQKTYGDGTPTTGYQYDQNSVWGNSLINTIGRVSEQSTGTAQRIFSYDPLGRLANQWECLPSNCGHSTYNTSMLYDLAGDLTQLTYPSGRTVGYTYITNSLTAGRVVQATLMSGQNSIYNYASGLKYWPSGALNVSTIGNNTVTALTETYGDNNRLQMASETIVSPVINAMNHTYGFVAGQNNRNVPSIVDQLSSARTQNFTYDSLNRLSTAVETSWGLGFVYDRYGNLLQQNVTLGSAPAFSAAANTKNQLVGYGYDAAGNMTSDGSHTYQYDGESRLKSLDSGSSATYAYDTENTRIVKQAGSDTAEYIIANGQSLSQHHSANWNDWSDLVYLNDRLLAKADSYEDRILTTGSISGSQYSLFAFPSAGGYAGYVMRSGDKLFLRQWQSTGSHGGMQIAFTDGTNTNWAATDSDGQQINNDGTQQSWHYRRIDLSTFAGKTVSQIYLNQETSTTANPWSIYYTDISIVSLDGSVRPLYNRATSVSLTHSGTSAGTASVNHSSGEVLLPDVTTTFYHGDHLGSSRIMSSVNGYPVWQATYLPFGYEYNPQITVNHYKFTGKERDTESGLDYFGARFYGSSIGRWMNPDLSPLLARVLIHPQRLNRYAYVINNPLSRFDPDGNSDISIVVQRNDTHAVPMQGNHRVEATTGSYKFSVNGRVMDTGSTIERGGSQRIPSGSYSGHYTPASTTSVHAIVELENVKDPEDPSRTMTRVRVHGGNYPWDSKGCPLVGADTGEAHGVTDVHTGSTNDSMMVTDSDKTADGLRDMIQDVIQSDQTTGEPTNINIQMIDPPADAPLQPPSDTEVRGYENPA